VTACCDFPASKAQIDAYPRTLPGLRGCHLLDGAGHWIQRERAAEVSDAAGPTSCAGCDRGRF
jgi:pimeloyl-ACP methyl ester carboxylesterase